MFNKRLIIFIGIISLFFSFGIAYSMGKIFPEESKTSTQQKNNQQESAASKGPNLCNGKSIKIGQTMDEVKQSLGDPLRIEKNDYTGHIKFAGQGDSDVVMTKWIFKCNLKTYEYLFQNKILIL